MAYPGAASANQLRPIADYNPFLPYDAANYVALAKTVGTADDVERIIAGFWKRYLDGGQLSDALASFIWTFVAWRVAQLGEPRIRVATFGQKMAKTVLKKRQRCAGRVLLAGVVPGAGRVSARCAGHIAHGPDVYEVA